VTDWEARCKLPRAGCRAPAVRWRAWIRRIAASRIPQITATALPMKASACFCRAALTALLLASVLGACAAPQNPFFAMDTALRDGQ
jgi:hypothetical protein